MRLDRRAVIAGAAAAIATPVVAQTQPQATYSTIGVDVGPLEGQGLGPYADIVRATLEAELRTAFADVMARSGPRLVVRITGLSLRSYAGGSSSRLGGSGGTSNDYLEGVALVTGRNGAVLRRHPQLSALPASSGGAWYLPDNEQRRLAALCAHFASWLRRALA